MKRCQNLRLDVCWQRMIGQKTIQLCKIIAKDQSAARIVRDHPGERPNLDC